MRSGGLKNSLVNRLIVVSRKPHGNVISRPRVNKWSVLPAASLEVVSSAVDLLSSRQWPQRCVWHVVNSMATSQCLHSISQHQLARLYEWVNVGTSEGLETEVVGVGPGREVRGGEEEGEEGGGNMSAASLRAGGYERWKEGEGEEGKGRERVACLSALIPVLAAHSSLHHMAYAALCEVVTSRVGLSPDCEHSLLGVCGDDPEKLTNLTKMARSHGHRFSRAYYRGALCAVLEQQQTSREQTSREQTSREQTSREETSRLTAVAPTGVAVDLLAMMSADWDKSLVETDIFWLALHLARDTSEIHTICQDMHTSQYQSDDSLSVELMSACLRTAQKINPAHYNADPSHAASTLVSRLPPRQAVMSATAFEKVFAACAETVRIGKAYEMFTCMTLTHGLAPTRAGLRALAKLLCHPLFTANHSWRKFRLGFAYHILDVSVTMFGGAAPGWVYSECARTFTELLGAHGYQLMHGLCRATVSREHNEAAPEVLSQLWDRGLFHALLCSCRVNHGPELATFLLHHMTQNGISPNERTLLYLLKFSMSSSNVDDYMTVLARHMCSLSSEGRAGLQQPLQSALCSILPHTLPDSVHEVLAENAVEQLLETLSDITTDEQCLSHLASLSGAHMQSAQSGGTSASARTNVHSHSDHHHTHHKIISRATA